MSMHSCNNFMDHLDEWMEGERPSAAEAHLRNCANCRALVDDLESIRQAAAELDDVAPPERVWVSLRAQLEQEGIIRDASAGKSGAWKWLRRPFSAWPRPAIAGAYIAALIAVAFALSGPIDQRYDDYRWNSAMEDSTAPLSAQLNTAVQAGFTSLATSDPTVTASLHDNLAIVDNYIALCEKSVRDEPENEVARDYLYTAYQQKAELVAQIAERGDGSR